MIASQASKTEFYVIPIYQQLFISSYLKALE